MSKKVTCKHFKRYPGSVFVTPTSIPDTVEIQQNAQDWVGVATDIAKDTPLTPASEPRQRVSPQDAPQEPVTSDSRKVSPSIDELFAENLPKFIEASRWGRYIVVGPASRIHENGTVFVYHNPCANFWDLYELAKGIFRDLGIRVLKRGATWLAHIPIAALTDKVFLESGLAGVEKTLIGHTGINPSNILAGIRHRQFKETKDGMKRCKQSHLREAVGDAVGILVITAVSWAAYVVMGV